MTGNQASLENKKWNSRMVQDLEQCGCGEESNTKGQRSEEVRFRVDGIEAASVPLCHGGAAGI
jgi:hypothetical protein